MNRVVPGDAPRVASQDAVPASPESPSLPSVALAIGLVLAAAPLFWRALAELSARWDEPGGGNSHGYVVVALVPWLVWLQRDRVVPADGGRLRAIATGLVLAFAYAAARAAHVELIAWALIPPILFAALVAALGWRGARPLAGPVAYLYFAMPVWAALTPVLQYATVHAVSSLLRAGGLPAFIDGDYVTVPAGVFEIAGGCAGTSFLVVALATATLFTSLERLPRSLAVRLWAAAAAMAVAMNWIRVTVIIVIGNATAMQTSLVDDHYALGWWLFAAGLVPLFAYARRLASRAPAREAARAAPRMPGSRAVLLGLPALAVLATGPAWAAWTAGAANSAPTLAGPDVPAWTRMAPEGRWVPEYPGAAARLELAYRSPDGTVDAFAAFYGVQRPREKLIGYPSSVAGSGWSILDVRAPAGGDDARATRMELAGPDGRRRVVWSWYEVRGARTTSALDVKLREAAGVFGRPARSGIVALSAECRPDCERAHALIERAYDAGLGRLSAGTGSR